MCRKFSSEFNVPRMMHFAWCQLSLSKSLRFFFFSCDTCGLTFLSEYKLYCHTKEIHLLMPFKCNEAKCVESYDTQEQLDQHTKQNHSRVNCPHCNKLIKLYYLPLHIKFYHDKDQRVVCDLCGNVSNNINTHKSHHRLVHDIQPRLQCDICKDWQVTWQLFHMFSFELSERFFSGHEIRIVFENICEWGTSRCPKYVQFAEKCPPIKRLWWSTRNSILSRHAKNSNVVYVVVAFETAQSSR